MWYCFNSCSQRSCVGKEIANFLKIKSDMKKVMVTGGTGYIGAWVVKYLLEEGSSVHITVRDKSNQDKFKYLEDIAENTDGELKVFEADLLIPSSFDTPMIGCEEVYHLASPFVINNIKDAQKQLVDPALKGTQNVLNSVDKTETVKKVILTSSVVAIYGDAKDMQDQGLDEFTEDQWNNTSSITHQPYSYSKVLAEKEAQRTHDLQNRWSLSIINPGFVMGPSLSDNTSSTSIGFMKDLISGKQKMGVPQLNFAMVDVRDVAKAHLLVAKKESSGRHIISNSSISMLEMASILKNKFGDKYALPVKELPKFLLYLVGWTQGITFKFINKNIGYKLLFNNSKSKEKLKIEYISLETTLVDMVNEMDQ